MPSQRKNRRPLYFAGAMAAIVILHYAGLLSPAEGLAVRFLGPALSRAQALGAAIGAAYRRQADQEGLAGRLGELSAENARLSAENARLKVAETENRVLREQLKFFSDSGLTPVAANVISRGARSAGQSGVTLAIDRGLAQGVGPGMAVVSGPGLVVGKVREARERSATVDLVTSGDCRFAAMILSGERTSGIARGELDLSVRMEFIPQSAGIAAGDLAVTSGLEEAVPRGLAIGRVSAVERSSNELWQSAVISPLVDLEELVIVSVVLPAASVAE